MPRHDEQPETHLAEEFDAAIASDDPFYVAIRGHQAVEAVLDLAISEALDGEHALELHRLTFALKIDLAAALGAIRGEMHPTLVELNRIRNRFAHDRNASLGTRDGSQLAALWPSDVRERIEEARRDAYSSLPLLALKDSLTLAFVEAKRAITGQRDAKLSVQIVLDLGDDQRPFNERSAEGTVYERHAARLAEEKERRRSEGRF